MNRKLQSIKPGKPFNYRDVTITIDEQQQLIIENASLLRVLDLQRGVPVTLELKDKRNGEQYAAERTDCDFSFAGFNMPASKYHTEYAINSISAQIIPESIFDAEHVELKIKITEAVQGLRFSRRYFIYPGLPVIASKTGIISETMPLIYWTRRGGLYQHYGKHSGDAIQESCADSLHLTPSCVPVKTVEFSGRTDYTHDQVIEHDKVTAHSNGNLMFCENQSGNGLFFLQEAPPSGERRDFEEYDFRVHENTVSSCNWGISPHEITPKRELFSYRHVIVLYRTGEAIQILKKYLKVRFPQNPDRDYSVTVNPWGVGCFMKLVSEQFLIDEIKAGAALGATHYQIDDGWQQGPGLSEILLNNRHVTPDFWKISKTRLPDGFENLVDVARTEGIEPSLWLAPSFNCEYRDWVQFAEIIYQFYVQYGIKMFKIDAVMARTKEAEDNLEKLFRTLRERSNGEIIFNLDTTNGQRPGYFMFLEYGNIFLENRYVCHLWGLGYHPERTLRCLWRLTKYIRPQTLQIEIPDYRAINREFYDKKEMVHPDVYSAEYWASLALFANPLIWLAPSRLDAETAAVYRDMIQLHLKYRSAIFAGEIYSIGSEPDSNSITGFQSHNSVDNSGFMVLYRERNATASALIPAALPIPEKITIQQIGGDKNATVTFAGKSGFEVNLPESGSYILCRYAKNG